MQVMIQEIGFYCMWIFTNGSGVFYNAGFQMVIVFGFSLCFGLISIALHDEAVLGNLVLILF